MEKTRTVREKKYTEFSQVTINEIAKILNVQKAWAYDLIREHMILSVLCGSRRKYTLGDVMKGIKEKQKKDNQALFDVLETIGKRKVS